jgi:hypothetical protein
MPFKTLEERKEYAKQYYLKNKDKLKKQHAEWFQQNKKQHKKSNKKWLADHYSWQLLKRARDSSKQRGLVFNISIEDIIIPVHCPYLKIELTTISNGGRQESNASLDRIDNTKGYIKGNVQVISSKANFMKRNASIKELIIFAEGILQVHKI